MCFGLLCGHPRHHLSAFVHSFAQRSSIWSSWSAIISMCTSWVVGSSVSALYRSCEIIGWDRNLLYRLITVVFHLLQCTLVYTACCSRLYSYAVEANKQLPSYGTSWITKPFSLATLSSTLKAIVNATLPLGRLLGQWSMLWVSSVSTGWFVLPHWLSVLLALCRSCVCNAESVFMSHSVALVYHASKKDHHH